MSDNKKRKLFQAIQRKSRTDIKTLIGTDGAVGEMLVNLPSLMGDVAKGIKSFKKGMASDVTEEGSQKNISENQDSSENQDIDKKE